MSTPAILRHRRALAADWVSDNPVLELGQIGYEIDTRKFKFGDGVTAWNSLAYATGGGSGVGVSAAGSSQSSGNVAFSNSNNVSFGMSGSTLTASASYSHYVFSNSNGISFGTAGSTVTASVAGGGGGGVALSAGTQSVDTGTIVFSNLNGVSFGMSGSSRITASFSQSSLNFSNSNNVSFGTAGSTITASASFPSETPFGLSAGSQSNSTGTIAFANSNGITFGMSGSNQITASVSSAVFSNSNNISFGLAGSTITASASYPSETPFGVSAGSQSVSTGNIVLANSNNISFGMSGSSQITASFSQTAFVLSNSNNVSFGTAGSTITASASYPAETPFGLSAGTQSGSTGTMAFANSNGITFGMSGSNQITASVSSAVFSNSNNVTFGLDGSTITASASYVTFGIAAGTQSVSTGAPVFSNANNISFGMVGSSRITASYGGRAVSVWNPFANAVMSNNGLLNGTLHLNLMDCPVIILATKVAMLGALSIGNHTSDANASITSLFGIYTMNGSTASLLTSVSTLYTANLNSTQTSATTNYAGISGTRYRTMSFDTMSITPGQYLFALGYSTNGATNASITYQPYGRSNISIVGAVGGGAFTEFFMDGRYRNATANFPASLNISDIVCTGNGAIRHPMFVLAGTF